MNVAKAYTAGADTRHEDKAKRVRFIVQQFDRYESYWRPEIERAIRNARMYWHVNFGQWPAYVVERLRNEGRRPPTFPIIPDKLETLIGSMLSNGFDMSYVSDGGEVDSWAETMNNLRMADAYNLDWETSQIMCLLDSHIMMGAERMTVVDAVDDYGNLGWEHVDPSHILLDPTWKSHYVRDLDNYFAWTMMTAGQIMRHPLFKHKSGLLREMYEREKLEGVDYGQYRGAVPRYKTVEEKWSSRHRVMEWHFLEHVERPWERDLKNNCWFPVTGYEFGTEKDIAVKKQYAEESGLGPTDIAYEKRKWRIKRVETICPSIDRELFLQAGKDVIQTNNVNLYPLGIRFRGQYQGIVDRLMDLQLAYNKGKMNIQNIQSRAAHGAFFIDRALSGGDVELEKQIEAAWNDPAARVWVDEGSTERLARGGVVEFPSPNVSSDLFSENQDNLDLADRFSKVSAAQDQRSESKAESGVLFRHKVELTMIGQKFLQKGWERHERAKHQAYPLQAKRTYAGRPRMFSQPGGKAVVINQPGKRIVTGESVTMNDISKLPVMRTKIVPSQTGFNLRTTLRSQYAELMQNMDDPRYGLLKVTFMGLIMKSYHELPEEDKQQLENAVSLLQRQEALTVGANIVDMEAKLAKMISRGMAVGGSAGPGEDVGPPAITAGQPDEEMAAEGTLRQ